MFLIAVKAPELILDNKYSLYNGRIWYSVVKHDLFKYVYSYKIRNNYNYLLQLFIYKAPRR